MPDHACARSHQKQEIDQAPPPSSPSDPVGYIPYYPMFKTRKRRTHYPMFHPNVSTKNLIRALRASLPFAPGDPECLLVQTKLLSLSTALISLLRPRR